MRGRRRSEDPQVRTGDVISGRPAASTETGRRRPRVTVYSWLTVRAESVAWVLKSFVGEAVEVEVITTSGESLFNDPPDVLVIHYTFSGPASGPALFREMKARRPEVKTVLLSLKHHHTARTAVAAGCDAFLWSNQEVAAMVRAMRRVLAGEKVLPLAMPPPTRGQRS